MWGHDRDHHRGTDTQRAALVAQVARAEEPVKDELLMMRTTKQQARRIACLQA